MSTKQLPSPMEAVGRNIASFIETVPPEVRTFEQAKPYLTEVLGWYHDLEYSHGVEEFITLAARDLRLPVSEVKRQSEYLRRKAEDRRQARGERPSKWPTDEHYRYGLDLRESSYVLAPNVVGVQHEKKFEQLATRGIWPSRMAKDVFSNETFVEVCYYTSSGTIEGRWLRWPDLTDRRALMNLPDCRDRW